MDLERTYVKPVYEEISNHFSNTRHYKWPWITNFIESLPKQSLIYDICCGNGRNMNYIDSNFIDNSISNFNYHWCLPNWNCHSFKKHIRFC